MSVLNQNEKEVKKSSMWGRISSSKFTLPIGLMIIFLVITSLFIMAKPEIVEEMSEFPPLVVEVLEASLDEELRSSAFQGEVRAKTDIELVTQVTGKVIFVSDKFVEGGLFAANETIIQIDDADYRVALKSAEATVAEAKVELDIELASAETSKREWQDVVGESIDKADPLRLNQPQVQRARARLDAAKAQLTQAKLDFSRTKISAPFAGSIMQKSAELGQFIARGASVGRVFSTDFVEIRIPMSDQQISELGLSLGQAPSTDRKLKAKVISRFGSNEQRVQGQIWQGYLKSVDASIDSETRLLYGTVVVETPFSTSAENPFPLAPGLFVDVELDAKQKVAGVSVPRQALRNGNRIYVVKDNELHFREVKALFTSDKVAVLSAESDATVLPGDMVVISPVPRAYNGMQVKLKGALDEARADTENDAAGTSESEPSEKEAS